MSAPSAERIWNHLLHELLPIWGEHGFDARYGGFVNQLTPQLDAAPDDHKRLLVQTRQIYVFSEAATHGAGDWALDLASAGVEFLRNRFWDDEHGGFFLTVTSAGERLDASKDLYAHSFVLLSMAAYFRATADAEALRLAERTLGLLEAHLADDAAGGFVDRAARNWVAEAGPRRQNPHMHLLEALLALIDVGVEAAGGPCRALATRTLRLLGDRFVCEHTGALRENFDRHWQVMPGPPGRVVEPGHHFEWVWLLHEAARVIGDDGLLARAESLFRFAAAHGVDAEQGGVYDEIDVDGAVLRSSKRLWPQTEYLKALAVRGERDALERMLTLCLDRYLDASSGLWREHLERDGRPRSVLINATSLYHIWTGLSASARRLEANSGGLSAASD